MPPELQHEYTEPHRKQEAWSQWLFNVGPPSATVAQHWTNIGSTSRINCATKYYENLNDFLNHISDSYFMVIYELIATFSSIHWSLIKFSPQSVWLHKTKVSISCLNLILHASLGLELCIVGSLRDREVVCSASDRQRSNFESCVWRTVSSHSSHHPQEVLLAQFSLYVHKGGLKPDSFHFIRLGLNLD